jgi:hypothetical protein
MRTEISHTNDKNMDKSLRNRILWANKCYHGLKGKFRSHFLTQSTKLRLPERLLRPVLKYGSESWTLAGSNEDGLRVFERKVLQGYLAHRVRMDSGV